ncbi:MAG: EamA family transporter, partial [Bacteroidetes bacterium]|nr:EamA family transporter [Bacteroidota bacterium]
MKKTYLKKSFWLFGAGLLFAILWSSASTATKFALKSGQPFVICVARFFIAGSVMLFITHVLLRNPLPRKAIWRQLAIYGFLNISLYLGLYVFAMKQVSPGLGTLAVATNPVFINLLAAILFRQPIRLNNLISLLLCTGGVMLAAYPLLQTSSATPAGLLLLLVSMLAYSAGVLYFSRTGWQGVHMLTINGWQTLLGGVFLLPFLAFTYHSSKNVWNIDLWGGILWLALPVSIVAVQLWLLLLRDNAVKASYWLFLCPISGYIIALVLANEHIGGYTIAGMGLVLIGLWL